MPSSQPIGLFDSGIGGTTIWQAVNQTLPKESTIFFADSANAPYGEHSREEIIALSERNVERLLDYHAKLIVVACNTATTNAIADLRQKYPVPFVGIEPAVKPAAISSQTRIIGILATHGTLTSDFFHRHAQQIIKEQQIKLIEQAGIGIVDLIESGKLESPEMTQLLKRYLTPMIDAGIDTLVLGCTHYPVLRPQLRALLPAHIHIIDPNAAVAKQTAALLDAHHLRNASAETPTHHWFTNGDKRILERFAPKNPRVTIATFLR